MKTHLICVFVFVAFADASFKFSSQSDFRKVNEIEPPTTTIKPKTYYFPDPYDQKVFDDYTTKYGVNFATFEEAQYGIENVKETISVVEANNILFRRTERASRREVYWFSHLNETEFADKWLGLYALDNCNTRKRSKRATLSAEECQNVPESLDWKKYIKISPVQSQKECGSCYIFSGTGSIEGAIAVEYGIEPPTLSRQHCLNCIKDHKTNMLNGCKPGRPEWIWDFSKNEGGIVAEKDEPYLAVPGKCNKTLPKAPYSEVDTWEKVTGSTPEEREEQIKCRLVKQGPFHIGMTVKKNELASFISGVFKPTDGICQESEIINHGMLLVGYGEKLVVGDTKPTKYWKIKNSWGDRWGEDGYLNVERGKDLCGFSVDAWYPILKKGSNKIDSPPAVCKETEDISSNAQYVKSICLIELEKSYNEAQNFCLKNGMRLFRTDSEDVRQSLLKYANDKWGSREITLFIDGKSKNDCKSIRKQGQYFKVENETDCTDLLPSICEYTKS